VTVEVFDVKHLDKVIGSIKGVPGVLDVERMQGVASDNALRQSQMLFVLLCGFC
jgi:hypothetical protein